MRDLIRSRDNARHASRKAKQRFLSYLLRQIYTGQTNWSQPHFNWLSEIKREHPAQQIALQEYIATIHEATHHIKRLDKEINYLTRELKRSPLVYAIQTLRGVAERSLELEHF